MPPSPITRSNTGWLTSTAARGDVGTAGRALAMPRGKPKNGAIGLSSISNWASMAYNDDEVDLDPVYDGRAYVGHARSNCFARRLRGGNFFDISGL